MHELIIKENMRIEDLISEIRGMQVMLDSDLAKLYECKNGTKDVNKAVNRNKEKFPNDFYFQLNKEEFDDLKFQFGTSSWNNYGGVRKLPYVFTEQGVAMLATVLHTSVASEISVTIMRAFITMRKFIATNGDIFKRLTSVEYKLIEHDDKFNILFDKLNKNEIPEKKIFFDGCIYEAYSFLVKIIESANKDIIIIDNYVDNTILDFLTHKKSKVSVTVITKPYSFNKLDIDKFQKEYSLVLKTSNHFHDRFIIIDKEFIYLIGSSIKDIGNGCTGVTLFNDKNYIKNILKLGETHERISN